MNVNYIAELNAFGRWAECNHLSVHSQLLMYKIYELFNKCGWPEWLQTENIRLMAAIDTSRVQTFITYRNELVKNGLIEYLQGRKGCPNKYRLCLFSGSGPVKKKPSPANAGQPEDIPSIGKPENAPESISVNAAINETEHEPDHEIKNESQIISLSATKTATETATETATQSATETATQSAAKSAALYKPNETKHILPYGPLAGTLPKRVLDSVEKWIDYKREKRHSCTPSELYELFENALKSAEKYGEEAVLDIISLSIANGYKGIVWDRLSIYRTKSPRNIITRSKNTRRRS
jgi:hypothetical protein